MRSYILFRKLLRIILPVGTLLLSAVAVKAQTTMFTYQGKLTDGVTPATGTYDFQFKLLDALIGGSAFGSASAGGVTVTNGVFTVNLDFGVCPSCFNGGDRFLAISVRPTGGSTFTDLSPRQQVTSTPYAIKSQNSASADSLSIACMNCVTSSQIASLPAGSGSYIQNSVSPQAASNFNISGNGTAAGTLSGNVVNAASQYNLAGGRVLSTVGTFNVFLGLGAGDHNTSGDSNAFFGAVAGQNNTSGSNNSFFGSGTGGANTTGVENAFFGSHAGQSNSASFNSFFGAFAGDGNTTGASNSFFGSSAGVLNTGGSSNAFFGALAGQSNTTTSFNSFFGAGAGQNNIANNNSFFGFNSGNANTSGFQNSFFGDRSGPANIDGFANSFFGYFAGLANTHGSNNSIFGAFAGDFNTTGFQNSFFGTIAGQNNVSGNFNSFFGYGAGTQNKADNNSFFGVEAGNLNTTGTENSFFGARAGKVTTGSLNSFFGSGAGEVNTLGQFNTFVGELAGGSNTIGNSNTLIGRLANVGANNLDHATALGADAVVSSNNTIALGRSSGVDTVRVPGGLVIGTLSAATATHLCINAFSEVSSCSSSLRYKNQVLPLNLGLELIHRLRPVTFNWNATGERDLGLIAEEVNSVEPLLVTRDKTGQIQGVKYDQLNVLLINAIKEQQAQIERLQTQLGMQQGQIDKQVDEIKKQQRKIDSLLTIVCLEHPGTDLCKPRE